MFEIVVRSNITGGLWYTTGGYTSREAAELDAEDIMNREPDYWCEVREERA